jgi:hypothetical protein
VPPSGAFFSVHLGAKIVLLGDRGFADVALMRQARDLGWSFRLRLKSNFWVYRGKRANKVGRLCPKRGEARFYHNVFITKRWFGPVHLALAWCDLAGKVDPWYVVSDEPTDLTTFDEYGYRFDTEELFLDENSANFQLEASELDHPMKLSRLALVARHHHAGTHLRGYASHCTATAPHPGRSLAARPELPAHRLEFCPALLGPAPADTHLAQSR